ncbi:Uncharacterized protein TCAP_02062 [Tolypocladium capitatum]|uniref:DUF7721 domain-containing protein n=1 Tax=Tolypocladium capitatum TaxID=45235 RepID=A0A2K3QKE0_9HYPO|nr:Uncharacterized protein TCAP_02062 [Tolypocladium capitatum]
MDKLFSAGKDFLESQSQNYQGQGQGQSNPSRGDGAFFCSRPPGLQASAGLMLTEIFTGGYGGNYPASGGFQHDDADLRMAHQQASQLAGSSGSSAMFSQIIGAIGQRKGQIANEDIDQEDAVRKHTETYQNDSHGDDNSLGIAAAMQALNKVNQGHGGGNQSQGAFLGLAMSEASKLFDQKSAQGKVMDGASKESTIQKAGEMAMKMYFKSQGEQQGGLMGMASKFLQ